LPSRISRKYITPQNHGLEEVLDKKIISSWGKKMLKEDLEISYKVENTDRSFGTMISGFMEKNKGEGKLTLKLRGSAGQSLGAFLRKDISIYLEGEANDYLGKGLSGGKLVINNKYFTTEDKSTIIGNTALYGATSGQVYIKGKAGHRFAVRNSGVTAVVEGIGNHGCEYMTGGKILVLGEIGENMCAGMSGGVIYLYDPNEEINTKINKEFVDVYQAVENDYNEITELLGKHIAETNSESAKRILDDWDKNKESFVVIRRTK
jgi:glutamate synthase (NADPH/NADH) large chain